MSQKAPPKRRPNTDNNSGEDGKEAGFLDGGADPLSVDPGKRWTANVFILVTEARLMAEGEQLDNPALPINPNVAERATKEIERQQIDHEPIWRDITEYPQMTEVFGNE